MAGEWIPIDIAAPDKPEMQELIDLTGEPVEVVFFRMFRLWSWASLNSDDGKVRTTPARLGRTCGGGDERFWLAVETVGQEFAMNGLALGCGFPSAKPIWAKGPGAFPRAGLAPLFKIAGELLAHRTDLTAAQIAALQPPTPAE